MTQQIRKRKIGNTRTLISFVLKQNSTAGVATAVDLTNAVAGDVKFKMFNAADGTEVIAETATGVTFVADATGLVHYDFSAAGVLTAGYFNGFFTFTESSESDDFPVEPGELRIELSSDTQTAAEAYQAALG